MNTDRGRYLTVPAASGDIKAPRYSRTRELARGLMRAPGLGMGDRFLAGEIATRPGELTAADAWTVRRLADKVGDHR